MMKFALFAAALVLVSAIFSASGIRADDDMFAPAPGVQILTPDNFNEFVGKEQGVLVKFAATWCSHCKNLVPAWKQLGAAAAGNGKVIIGKVDADKHGDLGSKYGVQGFPTIKYFPPGSETPEDYNGGRDVDSFIKFLNEKTGAGLFKPYEHSSVKELTGADYDKIATDSSKKLVLVAATAPWCSHCKSLKPAFKQLADVFANDKDVVIANFDADAAPNKAKAGELGIQGFPTIKYYLNGGAAEDYNGGRTIDDLVSFVNNKAGKQRAADGNLDAEAGTTPELIEAAKGYAAGGDKAAFEAGKATNEWFAKIAASIDAKGAEYVEKELARITKMIEGGKLSAAKRDQMSLKKNALTAFKQ